MADIKLYTTSFCPFCIQAKRLLKKRELDFEEINLTGKYDELDALKERTKFRTVPQIFVKETFIGGYEELSALDRSGKLNEMLNT